MADGREQDIFVDTMQDFGQKQMQRNVLAEQCEEIAALIWPEQRNTFYYGNENWQGEKKTSQQVSATGMRALHKATAITDSMLTPQHMVWHEIGPQNPDLLQDKATAAWYEKANRVLWTERYKGIAGFIGQNLACWQTLHAFGTQYLLIDELDGKNWGERGLRYKGVPWGEMYIGENHQGIVDNYTRAFRMTARQIWQRWPETFPPSLQAALEARSETTFYVLQRVLPRNDYDSDAMDSRGSPWACYYISVDGQCILEEKGYRSFPLAVGRYSQGPGEVYGRSLSMMTLPALKTDNNIWHTFLKQGHRAADPVLLTPDEGLVDFSLRPGALNSGGMSMEGRPLVGVLPTGQIQISEEMIKMHTDIINDMFMVSHFEREETSRDKSAREVMEEVADRGVLLAPILGRQIAERIDPQITRELDVLAYLRILDRQTPAMLEDKGGFKCVNTSPIALAMRSQADVGFMRMSEMIDKVEQSTGNTGEYRRVLSYKRALPAMARNQFVPPSYMSTPEEISQAEKAAAQAQEREMKMKEAAPQAAIIKAQAIQAKAQAGQNIGGTLSGTPQGGMPPVPSGP